MLSTMESHRNADCETDGSLEGNKSMTFRSLFLLPSQSTRARSARTWQGHEQVIMKMKDTLLFDATVF